MALTGMSIEIADAGLKLYHAFSSLIVPAMKSGVPENDVIAWVTSAVASLKTAGEAAKYDAGTGQSSDFGSLFD